MCSFTGTINYFNGTITYEIKYESNDPVTSTEILAKTNGDTMKLTFKGTGYLEVYNGTTLLSKGYSFGDDIGTIWVRKSPSSVVSSDYNGFNPNEALKSIEQKTSTEKILDIGTTLISVTAEPANDGEEHFTKRDYYFSDDLFFQDGTFKNCKYNSYDQIYSKTNTLPLKMVFENDAYKVTYTAIKIESN